MSHHHDDELEDHDLGLSHDLPTLLSRRTALGMLGGAGLMAALAACSSSGSSDAGTSSAATSPSDASSAATSSATTSTTSTSASATVAADSISGSDVSTGSNGEIPEETGGPYPGDGSNGPNVLTESGIVRSDIRSSFGEYSGTAEGVKLTVKFTVVDVSSSSDAGKPVQGAALYAWHCNRDGEYSMYGVTDQNYLRGVQETDAQGTVTFTTIFPAAYSGRWPHIHFEIYPTVDDATTASNKLRTSQLALPKDACDEVYKTAGYEQSITNLAQSSLDSDMVFGDGYALQLATVTGSAKKGYTATLRVPV